MNKIVIQIGLLIFTISLIFFSRLNLSVLEVVQNAFIVSIILTIMVAIVMLVFIRSVNKTVLERNKEKLQ